jgi:hypothetical protein
MGVRRFFSRGGQNFPGGGAVSDIVKYRAKIKALNLTKAFCFARLQNIFNSKNMMKANNLFFQDI